ncbi:murein biosynthesis integral membrane protein MurJ [Planococcus faecalis]|uniref:Probable lipid II flippase MurJ n=1 Tax=Planococcus faecalis TaxID=1598147 RepID=A0ABN4XKL7_9BACL|nr:murein biosynthesis integral membrane protein MurJ [Planococcus faecalis]AQU80216.1 murein biosynthesis integral membrane protein MurJ [Planococcus faecalis]OHX51981.1 murein biosynthesis integral membrane protein MurJ [Planococcus faecalis]
MKKTVLLLMGISIISGVFGFLRDVVLAYFYGASNISDAFLIAFTIPTAIFGIIGTGISTGYIPIYNQIEIRKEEGATNKFTNNILNILFVLITFIIFLGLSYTEFLVKIFASGFEGETLDLTVKLTGISLFAIYFSCLVALFTPYLQVKGSYFIPAISGFPMNLFLILFIILSYNSNLTMLSLGIVIALASQFFIYIPALYKKGFKYKYIFNLKDPDTKKMAYLALPAILGASVNQINSIVDITMASNLISGGISSLTYSSRITAFVQGIFVASLATVIFPIISKMAANNELLKLKKTVSKALIIISALVIPGAVGIMILAEPIVELIYGRGAFDSLALSMTSSALFFYAMGMIGFGFREILSKVFYSLQDTKTPVINASIAVVINIILNIILSKYMGLSGLALATSLSSIICSLLLYKSLTKKIGYLEVKYIYISFVKILAASILMGVAVKVTYFFLVSISGLILSLVFSVIIGLVVYVIIIYFLKIRDIDAFVLPFKKRTKSYLKDKRF